MSTENTEANVADKLAQALRDLMDVSYNYGVPHDIKERAAARAVLAAHEAEKAQAVDEQPFAWATYDGDGSYDLRLFVDNEDYKDEFIKRNPRYASWVIPLYERPAAPASASEAPVAVPLTDELVGKLLRTQSALSKMTKKYGEIGSRDVDVARWNTDLCEAIRAVGDVLADQPLEQLARVKQVGGQG